MARSTKVDRTIWRDGCFAVGSRLLAEEVAVAVSFNGTTHAVLMATPANLEDLAVGFALTEGVIETVSSIEEIEIVEFDLGLDVQLRVGDDVAARLLTRRRNMAGPVGCGLCGLDSLEAASRSLPTIGASPTFKPQDLALAAASLEHGQQLNNATKSVHAAGFFRPGEPVIAVREDVGRHNALDKLIGAMARAGIAPVDGGFMVTSRVSVELVQKVAMAGSGLLAAISAPTALAVRTAEDAGITLAAIVRGQTFEVFSRPERIKPDPIANVA